MATQINMLGAETLLPVQINADDQHAMQKQIPWATTRYEVLKMWATTQHVRQREQKLCFPFKSN